MFLHNTEACYYKKVFCMIWVDKSLFKGLILTQPFVVLIIMNYKHEKKWIICVRANKHLF